MPAQLTTLKDIKAARERIGDYIYYSPLAHSETLSQISGVQLYLKLENLQMTGSFKDRGAFNKVLQLDTAERARGVVAASAGNHAQAVAYLAQRLRISATIAMPENAPLTKVANTRRHGAEVVLSGATYQDAYDKAVEIQQQQGATFVHPFDDAEVIAGQGTIGLELLEQLPKLDAVVVPVGGGGLVSGIAVALKEHNPQIEIIGVEAATFPSARLSLEQHQVVAAGQMASLADGIAVRQVGDAPFALMRRYVDEVVCVEEEEIARAILTLLEIEKTVAEGAGAVALAAILEDKVKLAGKRVAVIVSGGNIDVNKLARIIEHGLVKDGRRIRLKVQVPDRPGSLERVTGAIAEEMANVLEVYHERSLPGGPVDSTEIFFTLETRGREHAEQLIGRLAAQGFQLEEQR
ncbi:MAG TPA: threonine ammonia-lyase [Candidatus Handelsmanbacteria bacterium]|nr:threonine ammonia-lyase [Candidatus Handelsmanbacteria bacterium]